MIALRVNGEPVELDAPPTEPLLRALRERLGLHSVHYGCAVGACGACTVLVDGEPWSSCMTLLGQVAGRAVDTVEGLAHGGVLHPVQRAFLDAGAFQCAYCTPGFVLATVALLRENAHPTDEQAREYLAGNLCRCGSYPAILDAIRALGRG